PTTIWASSSPRARGWGWSWASAADVWSAISATSGARIVSARTRPCASRRKAGARRAGPAGGARHASSSRRRRSSCATTCPAVLWCTTGSTPWGSPRSSRARGAVAWRASRSREDCAWPKSRTWARTISIPWAEPKACAVIASSNFAHRATPCSVSSTAGAWPTATCSCSSIRRCSGRAKRRSRTRRAGRKRCTVRATASARGSPHRWAAPAWSSAGGRATAHSTPSCTSRCGASSRNHPRSGFGGGVRSAHVPTTREAIERLRAAIRRHDFLYYVEARPEVTDLEYDALMRALQEAEAAHPEWVTPDSPSQRVAEMPSPGFVSVEHSTPMLSLANAYSEEELLEFDARARKGLEVESVPYVVELKIDGVAIALRYRNGSLALGITRGDGRVGDDVTRNLRTIRGVPLTLAGQPPPELEVRGEAYMLREDFARLNRQREERGEPAFMNPRNLTAGTLKTLDAREVAGRPLRVFLYAVVDAAGHGLRSQWEALEWMRGLGFPVSREARLASGVEDVKAIAESWRGRYRKLPFDADGLVIKVNEFAA